MKLATADVRITSRLSSGSRLSGIATSSWASDSGADASLVWTAIAAPRRSVSPVVSAIAALRCAPALSRSRSLSDSAFARERPRSTSVWGRIASDSDGIFSVRRLASEAAA
jgi:hypothetical protein